MSRITRTAVSRRGVLRAIGASAVAGTLAGCTDGSAGENLAESRDAFGHPFPYVAENAQLNPWAGSYPWRVHPLLFETPSVTTPTGERRTTDLIADLGVADRTVTITYSDEFVWWNGEPVTARDRWVAERLQTHVSRVGTDDEAGADESGDGDDGNDDGETEQAAIRAGDPLEGAIDAGTVTLRDEYTLVYEFDRPLDERLARDRALRGAHNVPAWRFEPWLERLEDATTAAERETVVADLQRTPVPLEAAMEEGVGCGPYELAEVSPNRLVLDRFEDHPRASALSIERLWLPVAMDQKADDLTARGAIDGGHGRLADRRVEPPDHVEQLARHRTIAGTKLALNWRNPHLARAGVREALACVLPLDDLASIGRWGEPAKRQTGMTAPAEDEWLDDAVAERLRSYPVESDPDRAAAAMREAGYAREGGRWYDADGDAAEFRFRTPMWDGWLAASQLLVETLESFGLSLETRQLPNSSLVATVERGAFDILPWWTDGSPYRAYDVTDPGVAALGYGVDPDGGESDGSRFGKPLEPTIDLENRSGNGSRGDGSADRETIDLREQWRRIRRPGAESETRAAVERMALWWNRSLPDIDLATGVTGVWGNTRDFSWPEPDDERYRRAGPENRALFDLLKTGAVQSAVDSSASDSS